MTILVITLIILNLVVLAGFINNKKRVNILRKILKRKKQARLVYIENVEYTVNEVI
jgi:hypothetical protein